MKKKVQFILSLIFGLLFINAGLNKFLNYMPVPEDLPEHMLSLMEAFMTIGWLMPLVGFFEIVGGLLFIFPTTRALGAIVIFPIMVGILLTNIIDAPSGLPIALILLGINLWIVFDHKEKYLPLITNKY